MKRQFDLPADTADKSLKRLAAQSGREILFPTEIVAGVRTRALHGEMTSEQALTAILAGTELIGVKDPKTGALTVRRAPAPSPKTEAARAETAPATRAASPAASIVAPTTTGLAEEPIILSPFSVATEKDSGYIASDSLVGGRISTNLIKTPSDVSVLTKDFLSDIAADSYQDAARWLTGTVVTPPAAQDFGTDASFRGLGNVNGGYPSRNYFRYNNGVDGYIVERLEAARGPNSLLFGEGVVSGVLNTLTKRARFGTSNTEFQMRLDNEGSRRFAFDLNRPVTKDIAVRVNLVSSDGRNWIDTYANDRRGAQIAASWRAWKGAEIRTELEWMRARTNFAPRAATDSASNWDRSTVVAAPLTANPPAAAGITRFTTDRLVYGAAFAAAGLQNLRNFGASSGTTLTIPQTDRGIANFPTVPRDFSVQPRNVLHESNYRVLGGYLTQEIGRDISFELAAQRVVSPHKNLKSRWDAYTIDVNAVLPNGAANPNFRKPYADATIIETPNQDNTHTDFRVAAVYVLPVKNFSQRFNVIAARREEIFDFDEFRYARANGAVADMRDASNTIFVRRYLDEQDSSWSVPTSSNGVEIGRVKTTDNYEKQQLSSVQFASVGSYWSDRVSVIGGVRRDAYKRSQTLLGRVLANGQPDPSGYTLSSTDVRVTTSSIGTVIFPIKSLGVYANYAESFNPAGSGNRYLDGSIVQPTTTTGKSAGLRFLLADARVVGSLGYYNTFERGRNSNFSSTEINRIWDNLGQSQRQIDSTNYRDSTTAGGSGYEADFVANLTKSLRVRLNYAKPDNEQSDTLPQLRAYYSANIATWQAGANNPNNSFRNQIQADINALNTRIENANEGRQVNGLPDYTANVFMNYTVPSGRLKNLRLGGGINMVGKTLIGNQVGRPFDYVYTGAYDLVSAVTGYSFRWRDVRWDVQLNVSNLLDRDDPIYTNTTSFRGQTVRQNFYYLEPRKFTLTTTVRF